MKKTFYITEEDRQLAKKEYLEGANIAQCCLIFQCLKRNGVPVHLVGVENWFENETQLHPLGPRARDIACNVDIRSWDTLKLPYEFEVEV